MCEHFAISGPYIGARLEASACLEILADFLDECTCHPLDRGSTQKLCNSHLSSINDVLNKSWRVTRQHNVRVAAPGEEIISV